LALARLRQRLEALNRRRAPRIASAVPPREKRKRLQDKRRRGRLKRDRRPPEPDEG
jgi:hypothetical protein